LYGEDLYGEDLYGEDLYGEDLYGEEADVESGVASRTAVFVCQGRAAGDGLLAPGRFSDPVAARMLRPDELGPVRAAREPAAAGPGGRERLAAESVRACAEVVVPRTVVIDEAVTDAVLRAGAGQVVIVGAGLDTRPWRLAALGGVSVFCVDHPASQADARSRAAGEEPVCGRLVLVPVDLTAEALDAALERAGHDPSSPTAWVWEGVVPYLRRPEVRATATALAGRSAPGSVLVANYQTPSPAARPGRRLAGLVARAVGAESPTAGEPWRSLWSARSMGRLLAGRGFVVQRDVDLLQVAGLLGSPTGRVRSLRNGRVALARFEGARATPG
jgi:methyltransferase (TIGR00027 family)